MFAQKLIYAVLGLSTIAPAAAAEMITLTPDCERAIALSALPEHLRARAHTLVLGDGGFQAHDAEDRSFTCLVARNHAESLIPQCFDEPGSRAILPRFLKEGELLSAGYSFSAIKERIDAMLEMRAFKSAERPGVVYMMSPYNYIYAHRIGALVHVPPHVMFHAPDLRAADVGNTLSQGLENPGLPFVIDEGVHGYMISMVEQGASATEAERRCLGQLPEPPIALQMALSRTASPAAER